jgi:dTMP kinase
MPEGGRFITFEGPEGGGKSSQLTRLAARLATAGDAPLALREPGGTPTGEAVRSLLLAADGTLRPETEALLFCAARAELVAEVLGPALAAGRTVLCDRYADSTLAYQGYGRGLDLGRLAALNALATGGLVPDLTLLLDVPVAIGLARRRRDGGWNRLDAAPEAFHERVRAGFLALAAAEPARWRVIDATGPAEGVAEAVWAAVSGLLAARPAIGPGLAQTPQ